MHCVVCAKEAELVCQRCSEPYCSNLCQDSDWLRHKHVCITKPPLIPAKAKAVESQKENMSSLAKAKNEVLTLKKVLQGESSTNAATTANFGPVGNEIKQYNGASSVLPFEDTKLKSIWREHMIPNTKDFVECQVSFVEGDGTVWVVDRENTQRLERLTEIYSNNLDKQSPCNINDLVVGALVGANVENKLFRGQVLAIHQEKQEIELHLIDYGAKVASKVQNIYPPCAGMNNIKAFAFRVKVSFNTNVTLNKILNLRLLSTKMHNGAYHVHLRPKKAIPLNLPLQLLNNNPEVTLVKIFENDAAFKEPQVALLQINIMDNVNTELKEKFENNSNQFYTGAYPDESHIFFLAARTDKGYRRGFLIDYVEKPKSYFLIYEMDEGRMTITTDIRRLPYELLDYPMRVFAVTMVDGQAISLYDALRKSGNDLTIKFKSEGQLEKDNSRTASAVLLAYNEYVCAVRASSYVGPVADVGIKYWREPITDKTLVYISQVISTNVIVISNAETKQYTEILKLLEQKCKPFADLTNVPIGCIVLVVCPKLGHFRGEITAEENGLYSVYNIDTGVTHEVPGNLLRMPCRFIENMPVSLMQTKLKTLCDLPSTAMPVNNEALRLLGEVYEQRQEFRVEFSEPMGLSVDLLALHDEPRSLVSRLLPLAFTAVATTNPDEEAKPPPPPPPSVTQPPVKNTSMIRPTVTQPLQSLIAATKAISISNSVLQEPKEKMNTATSEVPMSSIPKTNPSPAVIRQMLEMPVGPEVKAVERFYYNSLEKILVPIGNEISVMLLNVVGLSETGFITACYFQNEKVAENFQNLLDLVGHHGKCTHNMSGFVPSAGEMCLALFSDDNCWYRGVCLEIEKTTAKILYCDFGNVASVSLNYVKPIPADLLQAVYATKCYIRGIYESAAAMLSRANVFIISGFDKTKDFKVLEEFLVRNGKVVCTVQDGPEANSRYISIRQMDKILNGEIS